MAHYLAYPRGTDQHATEGRAQFGFALGPLVIIVAVQGLGLDYSSLITIPGLVGVWGLIRYLHVPRQISPGNRYVDFHSAE